MKRVFIFGYYGFKNIGDEAILNSIVKILKANNEEVDIRALSYNVKYTQEYHGIKGVSRNSLKDIIGAIKNADLVISGGGTLLQDKTSSRSLYYYLALILISKFFGKKVMFFCNGFGPIRKKINKVTTKALLKHVDKMLIRDPLSREKLRDLGINKNVMTTTDATLILESANDDIIDKLMDKENIPRDKKLIGISVRPWPVPNSYHDELAGFCDYVYDRGYYPVFVPMKHPSDIEVSNIVIERMKRDAIVLQNEYSPSEMLGIIKRVDILVGMRLHALIFACNMDVPVIGLEYDPKINGFLKMVGQYNAGDVKEIEKINLCLAFDELTTNYDSVKETLSENMNTLRQKSNLNGIELRKML